MTLASCCTWAGVPSAIFLPKSSTATPIGDVHHDAHVVLDHHHGQPLDPRHVEDEAHHVLGLLGVHARSRLVEEERRRDRAPGPGPAPRASAGRRAACPRPCAGCPAAGGDRRSRAPPWRGGPAPRAPPARSRGRTPAHRSAGERGDRSSRCRARSCRGTGAMFWKVRAIPSLARWCGFSQGDVPPVERDPAPRGRVDPADAVEDAGLAGAVGTDDGEELAARQRKAHPGQGGHAAKAQVQVLQSEKSHALVHPLVVEIAGSGLERTCDQGGYYLPSRCREDGGKANRRQGAGFDGSWPERYSRATNAKEAWCERSGRRRRYVHRPRAVGRRARRALGLQAPLGAPRPCARHSRWHPISHRARGRPPRGADLRRPRHDRRDQRAARGQGRAHRPGDHARLSRPPRDRPPEAPDLYDLQADKPRAARPALPAAGSPRAPGLGRHAVEKLSLDEVRAGRSMRCEADASRRWPSAFSTASSTPTHERLVAAELRTRLPGLFVSLSADVLAGVPRVRAALTTVINAYLGPLISRYLQRFGDAVEALGVRRPPYVNQSNGGIISVDRRGRAPVRTALSGPSAGVMGAAWVSAAAGSTRSSRSTWAGRRRMSRASRTDGRCMAAERTIARLPACASRALEIETVGAGGGSHRLGRLRGRAAGGPAECGRGSGPGLLRARRDGSDGDRRQRRAGPAERHAAPRRRMTVRRELAEQAIAGLAPSSAPPPIETARGIVSVVQTNMLGAIRLVSVRKGYDPRGSHAGGLRRRGAAARRSAGARSRHRRVADPAGARDPLRAGAAGRAAAPRSGPHAGRAARRHDGGRRWRTDSTSSRSRRPRGSTARASRPSRRRLARAFDLRYVGQNFELTVTPPAGASPLRCARPCTPRSFASTSGSTATPRPTSRCRSSALRLTAFGDRELPAMPALPAAATADPKEARIGERAVYDEEARDFR